MREESHLDDMRAAIRGDFERLEERRGEQELMRPVIEPEPQPWAPTDPHLEPRVLAPAGPQTPPEPESGEEPPDSLQQTVTSDDSTELSESPNRRSWLDRLLGR